MTSKERFENCLNIGPINDRRDIPIYPQILTFPGKYAGYTQKQILDSPKIWMDALKKVWNGIGKPDVSMVTSPNDSIFGMGLEARRPGYELGVDDLYQFIEKKQMNIDDYRIILKNGWLKWYNKYLGKIQRPIKNGIGITIRWIQFGINCNKVLKFLSENGVEPISYMSIAPVFDMLSMVRSFEPFLIDLYEEPDLVKEVIKKGTPENIALCMQNLKWTKGDRVHVYVVRSSANFVSPSFFDEFAWPSLSEMILQFYAAGIRSILHADGNWLPMLDRFLHLPKGSVHFEFDGATDIIKASEILDGQHSFRGDVPSTMLAFGTYDDVRQYCENLITKIGMHGGFMLGSGCEVPMNAKPENIKAMFDSLSR